MKSAVFLFSLIAGWLFAATALAQPANPATGPLPGDSVYNLDASLVDQDGKTLRFADGRGQPRLVSMFYSSCKFVCPMIIDTLRRTERSLPDADRRRLGVLMVSFDPDRDTPEALKNVAAKHKVDLMRWTLARAEDADVRRLAAVLGIQYKLRDDGDYNHSSVMILLDAEGRIVARTERMGELDADFVNAVKRVAAP